MFRHGKDRVQRPKNFIDLFRNPGLERRLNTVIFR
jgi:hypothetical protein